MSTIKVIESGIRNQEHKLAICNDDLSSVLQKLYQNGFNEIFDQNGESRGFVRVFLNSIMIENIKDIVLSDGDEVRIVSAFSGG